jgi:hypothetical protein
MAATWAQLVNIAKAKHRLVSDTTYDADILSLINYEIRPHLRSILMENEDAGWLEAAVQYLNMTVGVDTYTPNTFDQLRGVFYKRSTSDTVYQQLERKDQLRHSAFDTSSTGSGSFEGYFLRGNSFVVRHAPGQTVANGFAVVIVPSITDIAALTESITDIPQQFYYVISAYLDLTVGQLKDSKRNLPWYQDRLDLAIRRMWADAISRVAEPSKPVVKIVAGSDGMAFYK